MYPSDPSTTTVSTPPAAPRKKHHWIRWTLAGFGALIFGVILLAGLGAALSNAPSVTVAPQKSTSAPAAQAPVPAAPAAATPAPSPTGPSTGAIGYTFNATADDGTKADVTALTATSSTRPADLEFGQAPANGHYVVIAVTATDLAASGASLSFSPSDFYVIIGGQHYDEGNGNAYNAISDTSAELSYTTLNPGESTHGKLLFDLPSAHGTLAWAPNYDSPPVAEWSF